MKLELLRLLFSVIVMIGLSVGASGPGWAGTPEQKGVANVKSALTLRHQPKTGAKKLATISPGQEFVVIDTDGPQATIEGQPGRWYKVKFQWKTGWVFGGFVTLIGDKPEETSKVAVASATRQSTDAHPGETNPDKLREKSIAAENAALAKFASRIRREKDTLFLKLASGDEKLLTDNSEPTYERFTHYRFKTFFPAQKLFLVLAHLYEGCHYLLISEETGMETGMDSEPEFSPNGNRFFSASCDLEMGYQENGIEVFTLENGFIRRIFLMSVNNWGPVDAAWESDDVIRFVKLGRDGKRTKAKLAYDAKEDHWTVAEAK